MEAVPEVSVDVLADESSTARCDQGFLRLRRLSLRNRYEDGSTSRTYRYDLVERDALDAVAIVLWCRGPEGIEVCLRTALRPPLAFRHTYQVPVKEPECSPVQWEVPAGLVEPNEVGEEGIRRCAARETLEEVGLHLSESDFRPLGVGVYLSPGVMAEKLHFLEAEVNPSERGEPQADGSAVEERAEVRFLPLSSAMSAIARGEIADIKTELAIRRLVERGQEP